MTKEQIEKAVNDYIGYEPEVDEGLGTRMRRDAFRAGAKWRINSVWHAPDEHPRIGSYVVALYEDEHIYFGKVRDYYNSVPIKTWAYIDDLLPETKEKTE